MSNHEHHLSSPGQHAGPPEGHAGSFTQSYRSAGISSCGLLSMDSLEFSSPHKASRPKTIPLRPDRRVARDYFDKEISPTPLIDLKMTASAMKILESKEKINNVLHRKDEKQEKLSIQEATEKHNHTSSNRSKSAMSMRDFKIVLKSVEHPFAAPRRLRQHNMTRNGPFRDDFRPNSSLFFRKHYIKNESLQESTSEEA